MSNMAYQKAMGNRLLDTKPEVLIVMLYEGMLTKMKQARERFESQQMTSAKEAILKAMKIADALMDNLNFEEGGETAKNLESLYLYIMTELSMATQNENNGEHLSNAEKIVNTLLDGWKQLAQKSSS